ncbi:MAG: hypothetical protein A3F54_01765 [Candidatus Kerfeldbacteria bacterium RIFCSPHIGHO2_12_FULL_48_17]|uniref:Glutamine amidotransferase domain-containing protein n=1 Tax=Candidatus Kerfeldbacteria bacterium RIFCSPHIGHO2_12_FULL_48_17 TaxID=1798542 RepID=A0A1G2AYQ9_9BACT|nr:MAG: hypothetical protein A3F54_01765 [Candidatus Kerfeldbacteria bacterium RIFCSPHIGHO2_12_FULL_48_17]
MKRRIVLSEYAPMRADAFSSWLPDVMVCKRYEGVPLPDSFDVLILSGGPMSAHPEDRKIHKFLEEDYNIVKSLLTSSGDTAKLFGICLGAQLITFALGGRVEEGEWVRGWQELSKKKGHNIFPDLKKFHQFEFHKNHIRELPDEVEVLADSKTDAIEAFVFQNRIFGFAYHPEVTSVDAKRIYEAVNDLLLPHETHMEEFTQNFPSASLASRTLFDYLLQEG